jgi:phosphohistidine swiveling domain-containing protein
MIFSRGMSIQKALDFSRGIGPGFAKALGFGLLNHKYVKYKDNLEYFCPEDDLEVFFSKLKQTFTDKAVHIKISSEIVACKKLIIRLGKMADCCSKDSNDALAKKLLLARELKTRIYFVPWYTFIADKPIEEKFEEVMKQYPSVDKSVFLNNLKPHAAMREEIDLLEIVKAPTKKKLEHHAKKYGFIPMYDLDYEPYDVAYFSKKLDELRTDKENSPSLAVNRINEGFADNRKRFDEELGKVRQEDCAFLELFNLVVWFRDEKIVLRNAEVFALKRLYEEIALRIGLSLAETINLTYDEIVEALRGKPVDRKMVDERKNHFELLIRGDKMIISTDRTADQNIAQDNQKSEVWGQIAMKGVARGPACIIMNTKELCKLKKGDVMVTPMTKPDFITAIRKAVAIVTDEGGITSHAAIVSRELKKPCIIGTKNATKILKDGDLVEVDAEKGTVRKIK